MNDEFLTRNRKPPRPEFAAELYRRIDQPLPNRAGLKRYTPLLAGAAALLVVVALFTYAPAQVWAQEVLSLFRVKRFVAINIDPARMEQLSSAKLDLESLFARDVVVVQSPGEPQPITLEAAKGLSSVQVRTPERLPAGFAFAGGTILGEGAVRITADAVKMQSVLDTLRISDVRVPAALQGALVNIRKPAMVALRYNARGGTLTLMQSRSPEVTLPDGVDLKTLGQIGLRVLGMGPVEARQVAQSIDWSATLVVPVPANAASFREVSVGSQRGLLITSAGTGRGGEASRQRQLVLWSDGEMVFALEGTLSMADMLDFANSLK